jgi:hypothetical protein
MNAHLTPTLSLPGRGEGEKAAAMSTSAQRQFRGQHNLARDARGGLRLNQIAEPADDVRFKLDDFAGPGGAENFYISQRSQLQVCERRNPRVALRDNAGKLCRRFDQQYSGKNWRAGKMPAQEWIVTDGEFTIAAFTGIQFCKPVNEPEFRAMREKVQCFNKIVHYFWWGASFRARRPGCGAHKVAFPTALMVQRF